MNVGLIMLEDSASFSGQQIYLQRLISHLRACGDNVEILTLPHGGYARQLLGSFTSSLKHRVLAANFDVLLQDERVHPALWRLNRQLRGRVSSPVVTVAQRLRSAEPRAAGEQDFYRSIERRYLAGVDGFICHSETTQRAIEQLLDRPQLTRSVIVPSGNDRLSANSLSAQDIERRAYEPGPLRVVFVGEIVKRKGLLILLEALLKLPAGTCQLTVVGNTDLDALHMRVVYHLFMVTQLTGVTVSGVVSDVDLAATLARSQVLAVPTDYSGGGTAYAEGQSFGLVNIGTQSGVAREISADHVDGYLIPPRDPAALADRLYTLAANRAQLAKLSLAAHQKSLTRPSWANSLARLRQTLLSWSETAQG